MYCMWAVKDCMLQSFYITDNQALKSVVLPTSLVAISEGAFFQCLALLTAIIPT